MFAAKTKGFTLIELMIVVAIIGIIASVGYPSYQGIIESSSRGAVQADLMALASAMERHYAPNYTYKGAAVSGGDTGKPAIFKNYSPASELEENKRYELTIDAVSTDGQLFILKAVPVANTAVTGTGNLFIYSDGRKGWDQNVNGSLEAGEFCWRC